MRPLLRTSGVLALVFAAISCSDAPAGPVSPRMSSARLSLAPTFSPAAAAAYSALAANGVDITNVRIVLRALDGSVALDTVIAFPVTEQTLRLELPLDIQGNEQEFSARIELRDATGAVQFASTQQVTARDQSLPARAPAAITLQFVGAGAAARTISVTPADGFMVPGASQGLIASGFDASGAVVPGLSLTWTSSDTTIARVAGGSGASAVVTPRGPRGTVTLTATAASGISGTARITVLPVAARLVVVSGGGQTSAANRFLSAPLVVEVQATDGRVMANQLVTFRAITADGDVGIASTTSDAAGRASTTMKVGRAAGTYTFEAAAGSLTPVTATATATAPQVGPPTQLIALSPIPQSFKVGVASTQLFQVQLADADGNYVRLGGVALTATMKLMPANTTTSVTFTTDAQGTISVALPAFPQAGTVTITLTSPVMTNLPFGTFTVNP